MLRANLLMKEIWKVVNNVQKRIIPMIFHQTITYCGFSVVKDVHVVRKSNHCYYNYLEVYIILTFFFLLFFFYFFLLSLKEHGVILWVLQMSMAASLARKGNTTMLKVQCLVAKIVRKGNIQPVKRMPKILIAKTVLVVNILLL